MLVIGVTGGIGTGKSEVARSLEKLGGIVFGDPKALAKLNAITWPKIRQRISEIIQEQRAHKPKAVVVEAAILIEAGWNDLVDEVWVATAESDKVVQRIQARNNLPEEQIRARMRAQMTQEERVKHATVVVQNNGSLEALQEGLQRLWKTRVEGRG